MRINLRHELSRLPEFQPGFSVPDLSVHPQRIRVMVINEIVPADPAQDFYGEADAPAYCGSALPLFRAAGFPAESSADLLEQGVYLTNAVKRPKRETTVSREQIEESLPVLAAEIDLYPALQVIMLMGDVARKMLNLIARSRGGKAVIPSGSIYALREREFYWGPIRVLPSYIITGKNILIEKCKADMATEDFRKMRELTGL